MPPRRVPPAPSETPPTSSTAPAPPVPAVLSPATTTPATSTPAPTTPAPTTPATTTPATTTPTTVVPKPSLPRATAAPPVPLTPDQKAYLEEHTFHPYDAAGNDADRRVIAVKAATDMFKHFNITDTEQCARLRKSVNNFLYDRFVRPDSHIKPERYGFMKKVYGRKLWARSLWGDLLPEIRKYEKIKQVHFLTAYHEVTKPKFAALPERERKMWTEEANLMNEGKASEKSKAIYGDMVYMEFLSTFLYCARRWFAAHIIIISDRPSVRLNTSHAHAIKESMPEDKFKRGFLDNWTNPWNFVPAQFPQWTMRKTGSALQLSPYLIMFHTSGEPLLPPEEHCKLVSDQQKILQLYLTTHYVFASGNKTALPPYIDMPKQTHLWVADKFMPLAALPDNRDTYMRKPSSLRSWELQAWFSSLRPKQNAFLKGETTEPPFRWTAYRPGKKTYRLEDALYDSAFMQDYATAHGRVVQSMEELGAMPTPAGGADGPQVPGHHIIEDRDMDDEDSEEAEVEGVIDEEVVEDESGDLCLTAMRASGRGGIGGEDDEYSGEDDTPSTEEQATTQAPTNVVMHNAKAHVTFDNAAPQGPAPQPDDFDDLDAYIAALSAKLVPSADPPANPAWKAPSCTQTLGISKVDYLRATCENYHFRLILDWYGKQKESSEAVSSEFLWATWESDALHLPEAFHTDPKSLLGMMKYLNSWRKDPLPLFADIGKLEARLLFVALWHRDMHLILFDEDVGISAITPPDYFVSSQFTRGHFDMVTHALTSVASNIPVEGEPVPRYQPTLAANMTESVPAGDANDSISTAPTQPRPRPRQKPHPRAATSSLPAPTPPPTMPTITPQATTPTPAVVRDATPPPPKRRSKRKTAEESADGNVVPPKGGRGGGRRRGGGRKKA